MKNSTNITKYKLLSYIYDLFFRNLFIKARHTAFSTFNIKNNKKVLLVGVGTGEDLKFIPDDCSIIGIDISESMLLQAIKKAQGKNAEFHIMNAESLKFLDDTFDYVIFNLVLSVVESPRKAILEGIRVLKSDGKVLVFDKFISGDNISLIRKLLNVLTSLVGTDINRRFEDIVRDMPVRIIKENDSMFKGSYKIIQLEKV